MHALPGSKLIFCHVAACSRCCRCTGPWRTPKGRQLRQVNSTRFVLYLLARFRINANMTWVMSNAVLLQPSVLLFPLFIIDQLLHTHLHHHLCFIPFLWICQWVQMLILCLLPNNCFFCTHAWVLQIKLMDSRTGRPARSATTTARSICTAPPAAGRSRRQLGMEG